MGINIIVNCFAQQTVEEYVDLSYGKGKGDVHCDGCSGDYYADCDLYAVKVAPACAVPLGAPACEVWAGARCSCRL